MVAGGSSGAVWSGNLDIHGIPQDTKNTKMLTVTSIVIILRCQCQAADVLVATSSLDTTPDTPPQLDTELAETTTNNTNQIQCRDGWFLWLEGKSCYREYPSTYLSRLNYTVSEDICQKQSAHLVTIGSGAEEKFICRTEELYIRPLGPLWTRSVLLGLRMVDDEEWQWATGERANYTNWSRVPSKPERRCAYLAIQCQWFAIDCNDRFSRYGTLCETSTLDEAMTKEYLPSSTISDSRALSTESTDDGTPSLSTSLRVLSDETTTYSRGGIPDTIDNGQGVNILLYVLLSVGAVILCGVAGLIYRVRKQKLARDNEEIRAETLELSPILSSMLPNDEQVKLRDLLLRRSTLKTGEIRGRGAFGIVYKGYYVPDTDSTLAQTVAIKTLPENCSESGIRGLVDEAAIMADFKHANVMPIIGVCIDQDGGLPRLIPDEKQLLLFCLHIARGMEYLAGLKFVHRDLAARNCMVDSNLVVKVADFGLSRDVYTKSYYRQDEQKMLPVKWMSLESLQYGVFTSQSDTWSYGVTIWEVLSLGRIPYPELDNNVMLKNLEVGLRLIKPTICPDEIYTIMSSCWLTNAEERPSFTNISDHLMDYLSKMCDYLEFDIQETKAAIDEPNQLNIGIANIYTNTGDNSGIYHGESSYISNDDNVSIANGHDLKTAITGNETEDSL